MNYTRRPTRPDSLFYRDQRKITRRSRVRTATFGGLWVAGLAGLALLLWWMLFRH